MNSDTDIMLKDDQDNIQASESTCQTEWYTVVSVCMWSDQNNHGKIRVNVLSDAIWSIINNPACQCLKRIYQWNTEENMASESSININQSTWSTCQSLKWKLGNSQCAIKKWVSTDRPIECHVCFTLSSSLTLQTSPMELPFCGPRIFDSLNAFPTRWRARFLFENLILFIVWKWLGVATYFCFIFKRVNKIRKKNPKCDSLFGKGDLRKTESGSGVRLLIGKVR